DGRVAGGVELQPLAVALRHDPDHGLAAVQAVLLGLPLLGKRRQLAAQVDQVLVALGPVGEEREFVADGLLGLRGGGFEGEGAGGHWLLVGDGGRPGPCRGARRPGLPWRADAGAARRRGQRFLAQRTPCGVSSSTMPSAASWSRMASARAKSRALRAAWRSSIRAWMRASSPPEAPRLNQASGACCSRPRARPAPSSSPLRRARAAS